ncbi:MAG: rRNA maturation RNase YbeY [Tannerella sp.]|jgi:rRNA maturation RNase YbeY|nr:rRNA maturation RNase YbeY [Tannerella sp.]
MAIIYQTENIPLPKHFKKRKSTLWINDIIRRQARAAKNIVYIFCDDEKILEINRKYLNHNYYTDIITFDYSVSDQLSADIFISLDTVLSNSEKFQTHYDEELRRVMIHGILHLCGYDDKTIPTKKIMQNKEEEALQIWRMYDYASDQNNYGEMKR